MKKTILAKYLAVALAAGLTSFAGSAKATISIPSDVKNMNSDFDSLINQYIHSFSDTQNIYHVDQQILNMNNVQLYNDLFSTYLNVNSFNNQYGSMPNNYNALVNPSAYILSSVNIFGLDIYNELNYMRSKGFGRLPDYINLKNDLFAEQVGLNIFENDVLTLNHDLAALGMNSIIQGSSTAAVPEPSQVAASMLLVAGIAGFVIVRRRQESSDLEVLAA